MKIAVIIDNEVRAGGGFDQAINAILQINRLCKNSFEVEVFTSKEKNIKTLSSLGVNSSFFKYSILDRFLAKFATMSVWQSIQLRFKIIGPFENKLINNGVDIAYFVTPTLAALCLQKLNFITTVWDLAHCETPEFPEVRTYNTIFIRDQSYRNILISAYLVVVDSPELADLASRRFGVDRSRFLAMPFSVSPFIVTKKSLIGESVLHKYKLTPGYFFYPAQFWPHKNHIGVLEAVAFLRDNYNCMPNVVFCGNDHGNLKFVIRSIEKLKLSNQVKVLGYVPGEDMSELYTSAVAVIMPTYFGPTNLPPLEAWMYGVPLIYSSLFREQIKDAALLVDPDDPKNIAIAMLNVKNHSCRIKMITAGIKRLNQISDERLFAEKILMDHFNRFAKRRRLWD